MIYLDDKLFEYLEACKDVKQSFEHHPEGNVLNHSLQTLYCGFRESTDVDLLLAAMLHDIGKIENSLGHEDIGANWLSSYCSPKILWLIRNHLRIRYLVDGKMKRYQKLLYLVEHPWLKELVLLTRWDRMARNPNIKIKYDKQKIIEKFERCAEKHFDDNIIFSKSL